MGRQSLNSSCWKVFVEKQCLAFFSKCVQSRTAESWVRENGQWQTAIPISGVQKLPRNGRWAAWLFTPNSLTCLALSRIEIMSDGGQTERFACSCLMHARVRQQWWSHVHINLWVLPGGKTINFTLHTGLPSLTIHLRHNYKASLHSAIPISIPFLRMDAIFCSMHD